MPRKIDETKQYAEEIGLDLSKYDRKAVLKMVAKSGNSELCHAIIQYMKETEDLGKAPEYLQYAVADLIREKLFLENENPQNSKGYGVIGVRIKKIEKELEDLIKSIPSTTTIIKNLTGKKFNKYKLQNEESEADLCEKLADYFVDFGFKIIKETEGKFAKY